MPKLWNETVASHVAAVREAILDTTAALADQHGPRSVTMSQIAEETGIGRATLYKYFSSVEAIMTAWHERHITRHFEQLVEAGRTAGDAGARLEAVLGAYALIVHEHHGSALAALLHRGEHAAQTQRKLEDYVRALIADAAKSGKVRGDIAPGELTTYCLRALGAASELPSKAAVRRLVTVVLDGLYRPS